MGGRKILIADDEPSARAFLAQLLRARAYEVTAVANGVEALLAMERGVTDLVVSDLRMPLMDGMELLLHVRQRWPRVPFVLVSVVEEIPTVVRAVQAGAVDYVLKPASPETLIETVERALSAPGLGTRGAGDMPEIVGASRHIGKVRHLASLAGRCDINALITGRTGTGKELVARAIHKNSRFREGRFVPVNCAAIPADLFESQFFGHLKGAFTGATRDHEGYLSQAHQGTLFLDELESLHPAHQAKLLRVLDDGHVQPVGSAASKKFTFRVLAAMNQDPGRMLESGALREDLYFRLKGFEIQIPTLAERAEDIPLLARHFLEADADRLTPEALAALCAHAWPGNVRELRDVLKKASILAGGGRITQGHLEMAAPPPSRSAPGWRVADRPVKEAGAAKTLQEAERDQILRTLEACSGNRSRTARTLGIDRSTLRRKLRGLNTRS